MNSALRQYITGKPFTNLGLVGASLPFFDSPVLVFPASGLTKSNCNLNLLQTSVCRRDTQGALFDSFHPLLESLDTSPLHTELQLSPMYGWSYALVSVSVSGYPSSTRCLTLTALQRNLSKFLYGPLREVFLTAVPWSLQALLKEEVDSVHLHWHCLVYNECNSPNIETGLSHHWYCTWLVKDVWEVFSRSLYQITQVFIHGCRLPLSSPGQNTMAFGGRIWLSCTQPLANALVPAHVQGATFSVDGMMLCTYVP